MLNLFKLFSNCHFFNRISFFQLAAQQQPPPLIAPGDTSGLLYAQYASALQNADYAAAANYSGLMSPLLAAEYAADPTGGLFAR